MRRYEFDVLTRRRGRWVSTLHVTAPTLREATRDARAYVCGSHGRHSAQYPRYTYRYQEVQK